MLKIRLSRTGKKNAPSYRIVVIPGRYPRDGRALEILGHFNPSANPPTFSLDKGRLEYWLSQGAQMTEAVKKLAEGKYEFKPYRPKAKEEEETKEVGSQPRPPDAEPSGDAGGEPGDKSDKSEGKEPKKQSKETTD